MVAVLNVPQDNLRVPPNSIEAEQAVLGGLMLSPEAWDKVADKITDRDFYRRDHQLIFRAIGELANKSMPCDAVTLGEWFESQGIAELVGGTRYVIELAGSTPSAANIVAYADIVREKSVMRQLIDVGTEIVGDSFRPEGRSAQELVETAEQKVFHIAEAGARGRQGFVSMRSAVKEAFQLLQQRYESRSPITGMPTGFVDFDHKTAGLQPGDLIIVAARPAMGKCLSHDAEIVLDDGSIATIEQICRQRAATLATLGDDYRIRSAQPSDFVDDGVKPVFAVTTRLGRRVETTAPHPFLTVDGWKPLHELSVGDHVAVPRRLEFFGESALRDCEVKLLAYFTGAGGAASGTPAFAHANERVRADFEAAIDDFGGARTRRRTFTHAPVPTAHIAAGRPTTVARRAHFAAALHSAATVVGRPVHAVASAAGVAPAALSLWQRAGVVAPRVAHVELLVEPVAPARDAPNPVAAWLEAHGLTAAQGVPDAVFRLPRAQLALFLDRLFAADGRVNAGRSRITCTFAHERVARQVQHLLVRFGIVAALRRRRVAHGAVRRVAWRLDVADARSLRTFVDEIGLFARDGALDAGAAGHGVDAVPAAVLRRIAIAKGALSWSELARRAGVETPDPAFPVPREHVARIAMVLGDTELAALATGDVVWDRIESIDALGAKQVYDLTIPDTHNFVANDVCVHNTSLALNMAEYASIKTGRAAAVFSMEMSASQLAFRLISSLGRINQQNLRTGDLADEEWPRVTSAITLLSDAKIFIDDTPSLSPLELRARARRLKREHDLGLIVIDYLQLMQVPGNKENRATEISEISRSLKALAKELNVPVIALSQLNRSLEQRTDKRPVMADLRESGAIEQDADVIVFIYRDEYYNQESTEKGVAEIIIGKQRNGPTGTVKLAFLGQYTRFENLATDAYSGGFE